MDNRAENLALDNGSAHVQWDNRRHNVFAALSFVVLIAFLGLPVWWITTRVYRAPLPYGDIAQFKDATLTLPVAITIVTGDAVATHVIRQQNALSKVNEATSEEFHRLKISLDLKQREPSSKEMDILSLEFNSVSELDNALHSSGKIEAQDARISADGVEIFVMHRQGVTERVYFGSGTRIFVVGDFESATRNDVGDMLKKIILHGYLRVDDWTATVARHMKEDIRLPTNASRSSLSTGVLNPKMTLEVHVVDPEPVHCPRRFPTSQILNDPVVEGFLSDIKNVTDVTVKSQVLYGIDFNNQPISDNRHPPSYHWDPTQLQHIIYPIETYLSTVVTTEPVYHMVLYIPRPSFSPLKIIDRDSRPAPYNSFVVSGWGSVTAVNSNRTCADDGTLLADPAMMKATKMAIIVNLRKYFGLQLPNEFERAPSPLCEWEVQSMRYRALVEYTFSSMRTLSSLTKLLGEITNIVINDQIGASIEMAVAEMKTVLTASSSVNSMLKAASSAFEESEKAFFDPSLLALLYFPDDQKYAIYVPLFLPIGVPVVSSILFLYKHFNLFRKRS